MAGTPAQKGYNEAGNTDSGRKTVALAGWATPVSNDANGSGYMYDRGDHTKIRLKLPGEAKLASWDTPTASDHKGAPSEAAQYRQDGKFRNDRLDFQAAFSVASGPTQNGSPAQTEKPGQLDPDHSRWVMGYKKDHLSCAPTATPSSRKSRPSSSPPVSKP